MKKKLAIIGSGISGLTCNYLLKEKFDVTLFESNSYLGGHTATKKVIHNNKTYNIDTGFIVFNNKTYPNFIKLLKKFDIKFKPTEMSFSVCDKIQNFEYNGHSLNSLFSQRKNLLNLKFLKFIYEIIRFNRLGKSFLLNQHSKNIEQTLQEFIHKHQFSEYFEKYYLLPMAAAIWSSPISEHQNMPIYFNSKMNVQCW